ncbi:putative membrane protein [Caballeronia cordobensis]|nr:putative membrane protein [Burkholderia sp. RPE67]
MHKPMEQERIDEGTLAHSVISARAWDGLTIMTEDGRPATLAVLDTSTGQIIESGPELVSEVWDVAVEAYRRFLVGEKALRVMSSPGGFFGEKKED